MDVLIGTVQPEDAEGVVRILNPIIEAGRYTALDTPITAEAERGYIANLSARGIFHVAQSRQDGAVVGFQTMEPFATYTHAFDHVGVIATFVDLAQRHKGIGKRLFEATFEAARHKDYEKVFTYVRADNPVALAAYRQQGFRTVGTARRHARIRGRYIDEIVIEKFL